MAGQQALIEALDRLDSGDWDAAHAIVQRFEHDPLACWLHACLHKIEGDHANARYWYARSGGRRFEDYPSHGAELAAIRAAIL